MPSPSVRERREPSGLPGRQWGSFYAMEGDSIYYNVNGAEARPFWYLRYCGNEHTTYFLNTDFDTIAASRDSRTRWICAYEGDVLPISFSARVVVPPHVLLQQVGEESVLLNLEKECYFGLDPVGTRMWEALTKANTVDAAYQELLSTYDVDEQRLRQDLEKLIENLFENGLLETSDE